MRPITPNAMYLPVPMMPNTIVTPARNPVAAIAGKVALSLRAPSLAVRS